MPLEAANSARIVPGCPVCGAAVRLPRAPRIAACKLCGHRWLPTSANEQSEAEKAIYTRDYAGYLRDPTLDRNFDELIATIVLPRLCKDALILDVGCGGGAFLDASRRAGLRVRGLDVSEDAAALCRERGHDAVAGDFLAREGDDAVDAVTMWDVLEHLREPADFIAGAARRLRPGGLFIAKVPTYGRLSVFLSDRIPRLRCALLGAPDHVQYYTPRSLRELFNGSGLTLVEFTALTQGIRTPPTGGTLRKRFARAVKSAIALVSGEGNVMLVAQQSHPSAISGASSCFMPTV